MENPFPIEKSLVAETVDWGQDAQQILVAVAEGGTKDSSPFDVPNATTWWYQLP